MTSFLAFGDSAEAVAAGEALSGTAFQKVTAFRAGFLEGIAACVDAAQLPSE